MDSGFDDDFLGIQHQKQFHERENWMSWALLKLKFSTPRKTLLKQ